MEVLKPSRIAMVVAATAGFPYMFSQPGESTGTGTHAAAPHAGLIEHHDDTAPRVLSSLPLEGVGITHISQVFRFDLTLPWVLHTWPRVTTGLADASLQGYRVPLVTGTRPPDVAGALTYYFNSKQTVERIMFHGSTGDPSELVAFLSQQYGFRRVVVTDPGLHLYQRRADDQVTGELRIKALGMVRQETPLNQWDISLAMDRAE